jgi:hypothetical protein
MMHPLEQLALDHLEYATNALMLNKRKFRKEALVYVVMAVGYALLFIGNSVWRLKK